MQLKNRFIVSFLVMALFSAMPASASVNKSIKIGDNEMSGGGTTVNGGITVGTYATVEGELETVNGTIRVGAYSQVEDVETVNGSLKVGDQVRARGLSSVNGAIGVGSGSTISGEVSVVNGKITLDNGVTVARDVSNVNGEIRLRGAQVGGNLSTVTGDVNLEDAAVVKGMLVVEKPSGWNNGTKRKPKIVIGPGSRVEGGIELEHEVELFISDTAEVGDVTGVMTIDDAVRFSGSRP